MGMFLFPGSILADLGRAAESQAGNERTPVITSAARPLASPTPLSGYLENTLLIPNQESTRHGQEDPHPVNDQVFAENSFGGNNQTDSSNLLDELTSALDHAQNH